MDGSMNWEQVFNMLKPAVEAEMAKLPAEVQTAFRTTEAYITQRGNRIDLEIKFKEGDTVADKVKDFVLSNLIGAMPQVVKMLNARAFVRKLEE